MRNLSVLDKKYPYYVIYKAISAWLVQTAALSTINHMSTSTTGKASADAPQAQRVSYPQPLPDRTRTNKTEKKSISDKAQAAVISCVGRQSLAVIPTVFSPFEVTHA